MATVKSYKNTAGQTLYEIFVYVGRDELTGKKRLIHRRGFAGKKEATLAASRLTLDASTGSLSKQADIKFLKVYQEWNEGYKNTVRESTYDRTDTQIHNHILPVFGSRQVAAITTAMLQKTVNRWATEATRNYKRWFTTTKRILAYAQRQGYIQRNPADMVIVPKYQPKAGDAPENFWDRQALAAFFGYLDKEREPEKFTLFRVLAFSGMRRGECLALTWDDIDFTGGTIRINKTLTQGKGGRQIVQPPKTRKSRRTVQMDPETMADLKRWRRIQMQVFMALGINTYRPEQLVFCNRKGQHRWLAEPSKWLHAIEKADEAAAKPKLPHRITIHGFRHSHASALLAAGVGIKEVQERLGHEDVQTTLAIYAHVTEQQNEKAAEKVANYLGF